MDGVISEYLRHLFFLGGGREEPAVLWDWLYSRQESYSLYYPSGPPLLSSVSTNLCFPLLSLEALCSLTIFCLVRQLRYNLRHGDPTSWIRARGRNILTVIQGFACGMTQVNPMSVGARIRGPLREQGSETPCQQRIGIIHCFEKSFSDQSISMFQGR